VAGDGEWENGWAGFEASAYRSDRRATALGKPALATDSSGLVLCVDWREDLAHGRPISLWGRRVDRNGFPQTSERASGGLSASSFLASARRARLMSSWA